MHESHITNTNIDTGTDTLHNKHTHTRTISILAETATNTDFKTHAGHLERLCHHNLSLVFQLKSGGLARRAELPLRPFLLDTVPVDVPDGVGADSEVENQGGLEGVLIELAAVEAARDLEVRRAVTLVLGL